VHGGLLVACNSAAVPIQISRSGAGGYEAALVTDRDGFAAAWYDTRDGNAEIYLRLLDENGQPTGPERRLTKTPEASYEPSLERIGDSFVVAWYEQAMEGQQMAMLGAWNRDGTRKWLLSIAPSSRNPVIRTHDHTTVAAWIQTDADGHEAVWVGTWDEDGREQGTRTQVGPASKTTWNLNLDLDGPDAWVVFDAERSTRTSELFLGRVDASGAHLERLTRDDGAASKYPDLKIGDQGRVALTWYDRRDGNEEVYLLVTGKFDMHGEIDDRARRVTTTAGESIGSYLAWNQGRLGLAWSDKTPGAHEIYFQSFDEAGRPLESARRITKTAQWSLVPAIQPWREGFALAWNEYQALTNEIHDGTSQVAFVRIK
jgi:hypothetical protein